jgi:hypothetical protein
MERTRLKILAAMSIATGVASLFASNVAWAQAGNRSQQIAGTWMLTSNVNTREDGSKVDVFGSSPKGIAIFAPDGHFAIVNTREGLPKFASNNRMKGTPEENQAIVQGSIALYGRYSVDPANQVVTLKVDSSTWPSWTGTEQKRKYTLKNDELKWSLPASVGGTADVAWKRVK